MGQAFPAPTFGHAAEAPTVDRLPLDQLVSVDRYPGRPRP